MRQVGHLAPVTKVTRQILQVVRSAPNRHAIFFTQGRKIPLTQAGNDNTVSALGVGKATGNELRSHQRRHGNTKLSHLVTEFGWLHLR